MKIVFHVMSYDECADEYLIESDYIQLSGESSKGDPMRLSGLAVLLLALSGGNSPEARMCKMLHEIVFGDDFKGETFDPHRAVNKSIQV